MLEDFLHSCILTFHTSAPCSGLVQIQQLPRAPCSAPVLPPSFSQAICAWTFFSSPNSVWCRPLSIPSGGSERVMATESVSLHSLPPAKMPGGCDAYGFCYNGCFDFFPTCSTDPDTHSFCPTGVCANLSNADVRYWSDKFLFLSLKALSRTWSKDSFNISNICQSLFFTHILNGGFQCPYSSAEYKLTKTK